MDNVSLGSAAFELDYWARQVQTSRVGKITKNYVYAAAFDNYSQMVCAFGVTQPLQILPWLSKKIRSKIDCKEYIKIQEKKIKALNTTKLFSKTSCFLARQS